MRKSVLLGLTAAIALAPSRHVRAETTDALEAVSASLDRPVSSISWLRALRGKIGVSIPLAVEPASVRLQGFVDLINRPDSSELIPYQSWRGRLEVATAIRLGPWTLAGALEHESDHGTEGFDSTTPTYLLSNALAARAGRDWTVAGGQFRAGLVGRLHLVTCNQTVQFCTSAGDGSAGVEGALEAAYLRGPVFVAGQTSWLTGGRRITDERRVVLRAGATTHSTDRGRWQVYALALWGNDVGVRRQQRVSAVGVGVAWSR